MRTVFVFPAGERAETIATLDQHLNQQRHPWTLDGNLYVDIDDEQNGCLFSDWEPDDVTVLDAAVGFHATVTDLLRRGQARAPYARTSPPRTCCSSSPRSAGSCPR
ncbi:hypothetical protein [Streptomyces sp. NPDC008139]|uniref:hypothetical protein n=1 Tax=Streptomyces sp. NPDC008139 TaxID=3364814 RepID=UPI0036E38BFC